MKDKILDILKIGGMIVVAFLFISLAIVLFTFFLEWGAFLMEFTIKL